MEALSLKSPGDVQSSGYVVYRVYGGRFSLGDLAVLLGLVEGLYVYYGFDGYTYLIILPKPESSYLDIDIIVGEALEAEGLGEAMDIVGELREVKAVFSNPEATIDPQAVSRRNLGTLLLAREAKPISPIIQHAAEFSLYRIIPRGRNQVDLSSLRSMTVVALEDVLTFINRLLLFTPPAPPSERMSPLKLRVEHIRMDGSPTLIRGTVMNTPDISIEIPLDHHMFLLGKSRCGKSVALANIALYIARYRLGKVVLFDWVGNFQCLTKYSSEASVVRPGEDITIDLFKHFDKSVLPEIYEEASHLYFRGTKSALFTPAVYEKLREAIEEADSHHQLIKILRKWRKGSKREDERNACAALLRRIEHLDPTLYLSSKHTGDILDAIDKHNITVIDLSCIPGEMDKILFTLLVLRILQYSWSSQKPRLYLIIDEVHRLSPRTGDREWLLNRIAREGLKYNLHLILADQTLMNTSEDIWGNMGHRIIFNLDNPRDVEAIAPYLLTKEEKIKGHTELRRKVHNMLRLGPGEAYLTMNTMDRPISCYFKNIELTPPNHTADIDTQKLHRIAKELGIDGRNPIELEAILKAKILIRNIPPEEIMQYLERFKSNQEIKTLLIRNIVLAVRKEETIKYRLPLRIYLRYYELLST